MSTSTSAALPVDLKTATPDRPAASDRATNGTKREPRRFNRRFWFLLVLGVVIISATTYWFVSNAGYESTDDSAIEAHVIQVSPKVSAHVKAVHFDDNYQVKRGDLIIELDPRD